MTIREARNLTRLYDRLLSIGIAHEDVASLIRIENTLSRWADQACGNGNDYASWCICRDEATGKP